MASTQHIDLSRMTQDTVKSVVLTKTITHPLTIIPVAGGAILIAAWAIIDAGLTVMVTGIAVSIFGLSMFPFNRFVRFDAFKAAYFKELRKENDETSKKKLNDIIEFLDDRNFDQGAEQVDKIQDAMKSFERVLNRKFEPHEFAHARYHGVAEQVRNNALLNLEQVVTLLDSVDSIDPDYITRRIEEIGAAADGKEENMTPAQKNDIIALEERWNLREDAFTRIDELLSMNERALTELGKIAQSIATASTSGTNVEAELTSAIDTLNDLGKDAQKHWGNSD
jgi:hypothetical protein